MFNNANANAIMYLAKYTYTQIFASKLAKWLRPYNPNYVADVTDLLTHVLDNGFLERHMPVQVPQLMHMD